MASVHEIQRRLVNKDKKICEDLYRPVIKNCITVQFCQHKSEPWICRKRRSEIFGSRSSKVTQNCGCTEVLLSRSSYKDNFCILQLTGTRNKSHIKSNIQSYGSYKKLWFTESVDAIDCDPLSNSVNKKMTVDFSEISTIKDPLMHGNG